jgi:hypothetical protein
LQFFVYNPYFGVNNKTSASNYPYNENNDECFERLGDKYMKHGEIIGVANTATVYEWEEGKALKLFYKGYPKGAVEKEFIMQRQ